jgi:hypothetical protein
MPRTEIPMVTEITHLGPDPEAAGLALLGFRLADGATAKYALSREAAEQLFHFLAARFSPPSTSRPRHSHEAIDAHVDRVELPLGFLLHFETTDYADQTIRVSEAVLRRLQDQADRALELENPTSSDAER